MAKSRLVSYKDLNLVVGTYDTEAIDASAFNGAFIQVSGDSGGVGTLIVQHSNDGLSWTNIGTAAISAGKADYNAPNLYAQHIRVRVTLSGGPGVYNIYVMMKDQG